MLAVALRDNIHRAICLDEDCRAFLPAVRDNIRNYRGDYILVLESIRCVDAALLYKNATLACSGAFQNIGKSPVFVK